MEVPSFVGKACLKLKGLCVEVWSATLATCHDRERYEEKAFRQSAAADIGRRDARQHLFGTYSAPYRHIWDL
uniref:Uncharacterized protein n=1 Tax=Caenorhabditis japonica TaxID=281687 RepID=A0A8R1IB88_CAEJA